MPIVEPIGMNKTARVIGGGFGGMAAALRLRALGYQVTVLDQCDNLGGRAQRFERNGFKHDAGPTVLCATELLEELFTLFDKNLHDYVELKAPTPWYRYLFHDGTTFDYGPDIESTERNIAELSKVDVEGYRSFSAYAQKVCQKAYGELGDVSFHSPLFMARQAPALLKLKTYKSVWQAVSDHFKDDRLRRAFSVPPLLLGGNPFDTTSIYSLITHLEREQGVWFAMGGTAALVDGMAKLMAEEGIEVRLQTSVSRVVSENGRACGVELKNGEVLGADVVVSNADPTFLYKHMLTDQQQNLMPKLRAKHAKPSMGLFVLFFGARQTWPDVAHHTICFTQRYRELLQDIFNSDQLSEDFSLYVHRPTATDPSLAPEHCDSFYVLCPVPNLRAKGIDWAVDGPKLRDRIVAELDERLLPGLKTSICDDFYMTPEDFQSRYSSEYGAGFSLAPTFRQSAYFRYHNKGEGLKNLYLVGAGTHPGAGVPGTILSAKVMYNLLREEHA